MRGLLWMAVVAGLAGACAQVKVARRDGCWVRQTETFPKTVREEIGPCGRGEPRWSEDRVARLVQECMAQADHRWQNEALVAWNSGQPVPAQQSEQSVMSACMTHASTALVMENEALRKRIAELGDDREKLNAIAQQEREHLRATESRMADALGEAAKKPAPAAIATANSTGTASTQSDQTAHPGMPSSTSVTLHEAPALPSGKKAPPACPLGKATGRGQGGASVCQGLPAAR